MHFSIPKTARMFHWNPNEFANLLWNPDEYAHLEFMTLKARWNPNDHAHLEFKGA